VFVKICGITRGDDAQMAVLHGAHALGFIFWPDSPRVVSPEKAREIIAGLPKRVTTVGVFVNQRVEYIREVANKAGLGAVQLHGDETPEFAAKMSLPVIKAIAVSGAVPVLDDWPTDVMILADARDPLRRGGTGVIADWKAAAAVAGRRRLLLAGGLTPENVAGAVARVQPYGIDVSSGVEKSPGIKDHDKLAAFLAAVRMAESRTL
jgi:phosphoribosylanthranilate isomerase